MIVLRRGLGRGLGRVACRTLATATSTSHPVVLGVETSCDDTCLSLATGDVSSTGSLMSDGCLISHVVSSQAAWHERHWGGVRPNDAARMHAETLAPMLDSLLGSEGPQRVTHVAVTVGPGLDPCLWKGLNAAREWAGPGGPLEGSVVVPVNHLEAHVLSARVPVEEHAVRPSFPYLCVLVSGGHCLTATAMGPGRFVVHGSTLDDSLGEALDKIARMLGVKGGGKGIERVVAEASEQGVDVSKTYSVPVPMRLRGRALLPHFSFSGLKSHVSRLVDRSPGPLDTAAVTGIAAAVQRSAFAHIADKTERAMALHADAQIAREKDSAAAIKDSSSVVDVVLCGGVASNIALRAELEKRLAGRARIIAPRLDLCTDNAAMVAWAALERMASKGRPESVGLSPEARTRPRWPLGDLP